MSTHGTITISYPDGQAITIYQHSDGDTLAGKLARALDRGRSRWSEADYLARIIVSELVRDDIEGTMGYGILPGDASSAASADEYALLVDGDTGTVGTLADRRLGSRTRPVTFQEFLEQHLRRPIGTA